MQSLLRPAQSFLRRKGIGSGLRSTGRRIDPLVQLAEFGELLQGRQLAEIFQTEIDQKLGGWSDRAARVRRRVSVRRGR